MAKWLAKEFDWDTGRYTGNYYDIAEAGIVAVFVDSFYGLDTNAGTAAAPFKTLGKAITTLNSTGANGSRIFMNGIFSENLPTQTYWYEFIGCGGGRDGRTIWANNQNLSIRPVLSRSLTRIQNISLLNYVLDPNPDNYLSNILFFPNASADWYILNCDLKGYATYGHERQINFYTYYTRYSYCDIYRSFGAWNNFYRGHSNLFYNYYQNLYGPIKGIAGISIVGENNYLLRHPSNNFNPQITGQGNIVDTIAQFINPAGFDFNVRITSPLIGAGTVDEITGIASNVGGVQVGLPYNGITPEFTTEGGATITDLTIDASGKFTITAPATTGTLETALMDLGNIYPLENIDLFNIFDFLSGEITQGVFETFSSPRMALTIKLKYGLTSAEVDDCPWLLIEYGKQPTFSGTGANRVGNAADTFDPDTFQTITCRYMKLFITLQNNS